MIEAYPERDDHEGRLDTSAADYIDTLIGLLRKDGVTFPGGKKLALGTCAPSRMAAPSTPRPTPTKMCDPTCQARSNESRSHSARSTAP